MGGKKTKLDLEQLRKEIRCLTKRKGLYNVLRDELSKLGYWKKRPRGDAIGKEIQVL